MRLSLSLLLAVATVTACAPSKTTVPSQTTVPPQTSVPADAARTPAAPVFDYAGIVANPDRTEADRALDAGRHPAEMLAFFGITPGMNVAELAAGGGYTSELLARVVAPGVVYGQNTPFILERFAAKPWSERLTRAACSNITALETAFDAPFPDTVRDLDAVLIVLFYHDSVWMEADRARLNTAVFSALKPGGVYGIIDHSAAAGRGVEDVKTLHRIEESVVTEEVTAAGFTLDAEADFLRNPADTRDWSASPGTAAERRGTSDRFALRFRKPAAP